jgi:hypothetical protein
MRVYVVLNFEREVEDLFRSVAILAPLARAFRHVGIERVHDFTIGRA